MNVDNKNIKTIKHVELFNCIICKQEESTIIKLCGNILYVRCNYCSIETQSYPTNEIEEAINAWNMGWVAKVPPFKCNYENWLKMKKELNL